MLRSPAVRLVLLMASYSAVAGQGPAYAQAPPTVADGRALASELGCGACHSGAPARDVARARAPALGPDAPPLPTDFVFTYLADPSRRRNDIGATRMPDFRLDEGERVALALFLGSDGGDAGDVAAARARHPSADAARGKMIFAALGCAGCHAGVAAAEGVSGPDLSREGARVHSEWLNGFLRSPRRVRGPAHPSAPGSRMPDFRLSADENAALVAWLSQQDRSFATLPETPLTPLQRRRTERYLEGRGSCLGCHRIDGRGGRIGPSLEGLAQRTRPSFVLEMILDPQRAAPDNPMPHQRLPTREAERLARYLLDIASPPEAEPEPPSLSDPGHPAWVALGEAGSDPAAGGPEGAPALYARHCASCHGPGGQGDGWNAADLPVPPTDHTDGDLMGKRVDDALYDGIHAGAWVLDGSARMPAFGDLLSPAQIRGLVGYIRTLCDCAAPAWSRDAGAGGL